MLENTVSDTILLSGFQFFAADDLRDFFSRTQEKCPIVPRFLPENLVGVCYNTV